MKKILVAVDDAKGSRAAVEAFSELFSGCSEIEVILLHVMRFEGRSFMTEMLGDAEMATLREALEGTEVKEALDSKADNLLGHYRMVVEDDNRTAKIRTIVKYGHPAEEILKTAKEEGAELIIVGCRGKRMHTLVMGSVSREVVSNSNIPVLVTPCSFLEHVKPFIQEVGKVTT